MENNKYYTPTLNDFAEGLKYEWKFTSEGYTPFIHSFKFILPELQNIRVKYLDREDIESLNLSGFEITEYFEESHLEFTWFKGVELFGLLTFTDKMISFYEYNHINKEYSDCIFRGTIKNKSELIKLMQQLNIK